MVYWSPPDVTNGLLERYLVYASTTGPAVLGEVYSNDTLLFTEFRMEELEAGTTYFVTVAVSMSLKNNSLVLTLRQTISWTSDDKDINANMGLSGSMG